MILKHTVFMQAVANYIGEVLPKPYQDFRLGETRWFCQVYFGQERRIHYEVSRVWSRNGRQLEIGFHLESRDKAFNQQLLTQLDRYLPEIRESLRYDVKAEVWDRGWTKVYQTFPDEDLSDLLVIQIAQHLAQFIATLEPIVRSLIAEKYYE